MMIQADIFRSTLRQLCGAHRIGLLVFLVVLALLPAILGQVSLQAERDGTGDLSISEVFQQMLNRFQFPFLYPIIMLIFASIALRDEISNGTISYVWVKPIGRASIVLSKFLASLTATLLFVGPSLLLTTVLMTGDWQLAFNLLLVAVLALLAYGALFLLLSLYSGRSILIGFFYILIWETGLSNASPLATTLSIRNYAINLANSVQGLESDLYWAISLVVLGVVGALALILSIRRFSSMEFPGESE